MAQTLTISNGAITITPLTVIKRVGGSRLSHAILDANFDAARQIYKIIVNAQSGVTDDLSQINGVPNEAEIIVKAASGDSITVKHAVGNIHLQGFDFVLSGRKLLRLLQDGSELLELSRGANV